MAPCSCFSLNLRVLFFILPMVKGNQSHHHCRHEHTTQSSSAHSRHLGVHSSNNRPTSAIAKLEMETARMGNWVVDQSSIGALCTVVPHTYQRSCSLRSSRLTQYRRSVLCAVLVVCSLCAAHTVKPYSRNLASRALALTIIPVHLSGFIFYKTTIHILE